VGWRWLSQRPGGCWNWKGAGL